MDSSKRPFDSSKSTINKSILKKMEIVAAKLSTTRATLEAGDGSEGPSMQFPIVRQAELQTFLPRYASILPRTADDGVRMKDLDQIQQELEKMLSNCAVRQRALRSELESIDKVEEKKDRRGKSHEKPSSVKKRKTEDKPRHKNARNNLRILKVKPSQPVATNVNNVLMDSTDIPRIPKYDTSDRFWLSVDAYCQDVTKEHLVFLDELIKECSQEVDVKIPALGEHYATEWSEHGIQEEQSNGCIMVDSLLEEKAMASLLFTTVLDKFKSADYIKGVHGIKNGLCLEKRLRKEGLLDVDDFSKSISREDEILQEIKKCQKELETVNQHNITELNKLREVVRKDLQKQEIKAELEKVDREILTMYNKVLMAKEKQQDFTQFEPEANALIRQQVYLNNELERNPSE